MNEIELHLAASDIDITPIIRSAVDSDEEEIVPTARWDFYTSAHPIVDKRMVSRLKAIFMNYAGQNRMTSRGLQAGKVDSRRLYRAPVSGRCFQEIFHIPDLDWSVTLLMDASGSMKGSKWKMVENTVANLHWALKGYRNRLQAFAYFERDGILMISQLLKENRLLSVPPNGLTASGQALIAAAYLMGKKRKRNILIHVTDGESNFGCNVQYGIDYCKKQNIHLITLGCGYKDKDAMHKQYGKTIQFLDHFGQLPRAIERLLKWTFLYGKMPLG
ncbi:MAG: VWA domain-containing protein [Desulfobacterales bacterium]|nr:VWA domain-containing protein [Desulfobacterales bacterium]